MASEFDRNEEELRRMERYFRGELPPGEGAAFENELNMNPSLKQKYNQWRLLFVGIGEASLQEKLADFHQAVAEEQEPVKKAKTIVFSTWLVAASAAAAVVLAVWLLFFNVSTGEKTFEAWYKPDPGLPTVMGGTDQYAFDKAMVEYKAGNYKQAIQDWEALRQRQPGDTLHYFLGLALLADGQTEKALSQLQSVTGKTITAQAATGLKADAAWYTGLALIRLDRNEEAKPFIQVSGRSEVEELVKALAN